MKTTNMRSGFTMIELIFVIVIIGILAAVAVPKLANTSKEARKGVVEAYIGSLNRTVGATMWAEAIRDNSGSIKHATKYCAVLATAGNDYVEPIDEVTIDANCNITLAGALSGESTTTNTFDDGDLKKGPHWTFKW